MKTIIHQSLRRIEAQLQLIAEQQQTPSCQLLAVTKRRSVDEIVALYECGCRRFAENYLQEAIEKYTPLKKQYPDMELHFIGHLQRNKVADVVSFFDVIHTVDRLRLLTPLARAMQRLKKTPRLLLQVNLAAEEQKSGVAVAALDDLLQQCSAAGLTICGLMTILPAEVSRHAMDADGIDHHIVPAADGSTSAKDYFLQLKHLADHYHLPELSMGMSADYPLAASCGSTLVRIGRALFAA